MKELHEGKVALTFGLFLAGWHVIWSLLIVLGVAQALVDFVFWMHMLTIPYKVTGFNLVQALVLVMVTFVVGYVVGWAFAWLWNKNTQS
jgi:heme/copper-type cytochrome/quinol oxidase subunit 4